MLQGRRIAPLPIDLSHAARRSVTSLFSNLVTRPTGRAIRTGVESQIAEMEDAERQVTMSILDFSQVRVLDYSCADEIVAKLLLRYLGEERPAEAFFVVRNLQEHHVEAIEAVLERHGLLVVAVDDDGPVLLLGETDPVQRAVWDALVRRGRASRAELAEETGLAREAVTGALTHFYLKRVAAVHVDGTVSPLSALLLQDA
ncbi:hypothetical protein [Longimicrobium terrae]|uniref:DUF4325 domain-containing protein n=1 Tax=Longimicrobium terrae TaxID=1639882 RepID=A0A841H4Y0_9BACT|nr:hypothetical protein [Longimicrobium terrae]MBB4638789.1 hypothetical protein [Longimicrobium terrae]MBB6073028.1 hypothetical protein [Longimicrobium terrae]NNC33151.1 hypothetical protein [Longimicrobium terrae]